MIADTQATAADRQEVLTVSEASRLLRLSLNSTYAAAHRGQIPSIRVGRRLLIPRKALALLLGGELQVSVTVKNGSAKPAV